jgi:hypothetical protein
MPSKFHSLVTTAAAKVSDLEGLSYNKVRYFVRTDYAVGFCCPVLDT